MRVKKDLQPKGVEPALSKTFELQRGRLQWVE